MKGEKMKGEEARPLSEGDASDEAVIDIEHNLILRRYTQPLIDILDDDDVNDVMINGPGDVFIERSGIYERFIDTDDHFSLVNLERIARLIASSTKKPIGPHSPILSAELANGERIEVIVPPACPVGSIVMSIRKRNPLDLSIADFKAAGAFDAVRLSHESVHDETEEKLCKYYEEKEVVRFLELAVPAKKTILLVGPTGSGKTTFANGILKLVPAHERIITIESVREAIVANINRVHLLTPPKNAREPGYDISDLFVSCLRLNPDRIMVSEIRGSDIINFLDTITSGHDGAITTLHAKSSADAYDRMLGMVRKSPEFLNSSDDLILSMLHRYIDVVLVFDKGLDGVRKMTEFYYEGYVQNRP